MYKRFEPNKPETVANRLREIMAEKGLRAVDLVNKCEGNPYDIKITKCDISQYLNGRSEPSQNKVFILSDVLGVNEAWLLGYDVNKDKKSFSPSNAKANYALISKYNSLSERDQALVNSLIDSMILHNA